MSFQLLFTVHLWVARGQAAPQKQIFFFLFAYKLGTFPTAKMASQNISVEDVVAEDACFGWLKYVAVSS